MNMNTTTGCRVLVAEDELDMLHGLERMLGQRGYRVYGAAGGLEAAEKLRNGLFDVVVSDLRMPDLDGMALLRLTRSKSTATVFVMITAYGTTASAAEAMRLGAFDYINKPFAVEDLVGAIEKGLKQQQQQAATTRSVAQLSEVVEPPPVDNWLRSVWRETQSLDLDPALAAVVGLARDAFGARLGFEKRWEREPYVVAAAGSSSLSRAEPCIPLYREVYLVVESWGTLAESEKTRVVQFLRRVVLGKLVLLW